MMTPPLFVDVVAESELLAAWNWLQLAAPTKIRPTGAQQFAKCFYALSGNPIEVQNITSLVLASLLLKSHDPIDHLIINSEGFATRYQHGAALDVDIRKQLEREDRFRALLAEHLAFWFTLAIENSAKPVRVVATLPHPTTYTQGLDGVLASQTPNQLLIQIQSAKNSINNPRSSVASTRLRKGLQPTRGKAADDFVLISEKYQTGVLTAQLDRYLCELCDRLNYSANEEILYGLLARAIFNAIVVANQIYAIDKTFDGLDRVTSDPLRRIATFIGSSSWKRFSEQVRIECRNRLVIAGVSI